MIHNFVATGVDPKKTQGLTDSLLDVLEHGLHGRKVELVRPFEKETTRTSVDCKETVLVSRTVERRTEDGVECRFIWKENQKTGETELIFMFFVSSCALPWVSRICHELKMAKVPKIISVNRADPSRSQTSDITGLLKEYLREDGKVADVITPDMLMGFVRELQAEIIPYHNRVVCAVNALRANADGQYGKELGKVVAGTLLSCDEVL